MIFVSLKQIILAAVLFAPCMAVSSPRGKVARGLQARAFGGLGDLSEQLHGMSIINAGPDNVEIAY